MVMKKNIIKPISRTALLTSCALFTMLSSGVYAVEGAEDGLFEVEEIIITANKRAQSLQDVPTSVAAVTGGQVRNRGLQSINDLVVPGLDIQERSPGFNRITIRGISPSPGTSATAGMYVDETPYVLTIGGQSDLGADVRLFDIERVEVLRGPQGTLYGEGAMGGLLRIIRNKPNISEFEGTVQGQYFDYAEGGDGFSTDFMVNIPIVADKLAVRATGYYREEDGYIDDVQRGLADINDTRIAAGRVSIRYQAENLTVDASVDVYDSDTGVWGINADKNYQTTFFADTYNKDHYAVYNLTWDYDFGWANLVSSSSYFDRNVDWVSDVSTAGIISLVNARLGGLTGGEPITGTVTNGIWSIEAFTQEVRLVSNADNRLRWTAGLFYKSGSGDILTTAETIPLVPANLFTNVVLPESKQYAVFGEIEYDITEKLHAVVGLRQFREEQKNSIFNDGAFVSIPIDVNIPLTYNTTQPRFSLLYDVNDNTTVYATISKGFRAGGVNPVFENARAADPAAGGDPDTPATFAQETLWNYEAGVKGAWLDNMIAANLSGFYMKWTDLQTRVNKSNPALNYNDNIGAAHTAGLELDMEFRPAFGLNFSGALQILDTEVDEGTASFPEGDRLSNAPKYKISLNGEYIVPVTADWSAFVRANYSKTGGSFANLPNAADEFSDSYEMVNLRLGIETAGLQIELFADNLLNAFLPYSARTVTGTGTGLPEFFIRPPRKIGLQIRKDF